MDTALAKKPNGSEAVIPIQPTMMDLLQIAIQNNSAIDIIERLEAMRQKAQEREDEIAFHQSLSRVQAEIKRVAPDLENPQTHSKYASYAALDRIVRPLYTSENICLSFDTEDPPNPDTVRVVCYASLGAFTRKYKVEMPADGKGAKGGDVMTKTHATGAAMTYGQRYLLKLIFNIAIGPDTDGNLTNEQFSGATDEIAAAPNFDELESAFKKHYQAAKGNVSAQKVLVEAKDRRRGQLRQISPAMGVKVDFRK